MIIITGTATLKDGAAEAFADAAAPMLAASRDEPGCIEYRYSFDVEDPQTVVFFEAWETEAALMAHLGTPHMAEFLAASSELMTGRAAMARYDGAEPATFG